jgi:hypothetical protein
MRKTYPEWIWRSYDARPAWAAEATIVEWASRELGARARRIFKAYFSIRDDESEGNDGEVN